MDIFAPRHLILILLIVLLVFGTKKLKTIGAGPGSAVKGFKESMRAGEAEDQTADAAKQPVNQIGTPSGTEAGKDHKVT